MLNCYFKSFSFTIINRCYLNILYNLKKTTKNTYKMNSLTFNVSRFTYKSGIISIGSMFPNTPDKSISLAKTNICVY